MYVYKVCLLLDCVQSYLVFLSLFILNTHISLLVDNIASYVIGESMSKVSHLQIFLK